MTIPMDDTYETVIGLEVHVHLNTKTKAFCACRSEFGNAPNTLVCPVCLGLPGSLPVLNKLAFDAAIKVGLALHCAVQRFTKFDRKHYYYPDLPKNYQISQYDLPIALQGNVQIDSGEKERRIGITRVHLEEDAGKLIHKEEASLVDFNRAGVALLEIVTQPEIASPEEAYEFLTNLKSIIQYLDVSDCDMEKGSLRCDANISIRKKGASLLGTKTEVKNMNSFKAVKEALTFERDRQIKIVNAQEALVQETRLWDPKAQETVSMRSKEEANDYRYFPEPDLPPFTISDEHLAAISNTIPELPREKQTRFMKEYGLSSYDAHILVLSSQDASFCEECLRVYPNQDKKPMANWIIGPLMAEANTRHVSLSDLALSAAAFAELITLIETATISQLVAKSVLTEMIETGRRSSLIVKEKQLSQISDSSTLDTLIDEVVRENMKSMNDIKAGKSNALMFLVGQVMKKTGSRANPKIVQEMLKRRLLDE